MKVDRLGGWVQTMLLLDHFDLFVSGRLSFTRFWRTGLNRNGLFPDHSFGVSKKVAFLNPEVKAGIVYKLNGRNYFLLTAVILVRPLILTMCLLRPGQETLCKAIPSGAKSPKRLRAATG